jgi:hypothetical protein
VEVGVGLCDALCVRQRIARLDQDVEAPALDFGALVDSRLDDRQLVNVGAFSVSRSVTLLSSPLVLCSPDSPRELF